MNVLTYNSAARGAGQFVRGLKLAETITGAFSDASCVILVGNSVAKRPVPARTEIVAMPEISKTIEGRLVSRYVNLERAFAHRQAVIWDAIRRIGPDAFLVDSRPAGLNGELREVLQQLNRHSECKKVLMLRDIVDDPDVVKAQWRDLGIYDLIDKSYDKIIIFGDETMYDAIAAYGLHPWRQKVSYLGYLGSARSADRPTSDHAASAMPTTILVTVGGGFDGANIIETVCAYIEAGGAVVDRSHFKLVLGCNSPLVPSALLSRYNRLSQGVEIIAHVECLDDLVSGASLVVSMCGYNTMAELVEAGKKIIGVPRSHSGREQVMRAEAIQKIYDGIWIVPEEHLSIETLARAVDSALAAPSPTTVVPMNGRSALARFFRDEVRRA